MTVKELKKALKGVPDDVEVRALKDGVYCEKTDVWWASYQDGNEEDEDGEVCQEFVINC
jgi:hypothetical protein